MYEHGIIRGYHRSYKHDDDPSSDGIVESIYNGIMEEIHAWFDFEELNDK